MSDANTVQQINQWYRNEPLTAGHLNQMVNAINFLLKTTGYLLNRTALANYSSSDASASNYPGIIEKVTVKSDATTPAISYGNLILPPLTGISSVVWDANITEPGIVEDTLHLNPAGDSQPGYLASVCFDDAEGAPSLQSGGIHLPAAGNNSPGFLSAIEYIESATSPSISCSKIILNPADSTRGPIPGYIKSVGYNTSLTAPVIENGEIQLNPADVNIPGYVQGVEYILDSTIPDIYQGKIRLNPAFYDPSDVSSAPSPGYVSAIEYIETATAPTISRGKIQLNPACYDPTDSSVYPRPGYITSVESIAYDPSDTSVPDAEKQPRIIDGKIIIPLPEQSFSVEYVFGVEATPGSDGWVQTLYLYGLWSGQKNLEYFSRQLMRFSGRTLQVVQQISYDGNTWSDSSANG